MGKLIIIILMLFFISCKSYKQIESKNEQVLTIQRQDAATENVRETSVITAQEETVMNENTWSYRREYYPSVLGDTLPLALKSEEWKGTNKTQDINKKSQSEANIQIETDLKSTENIDNHLNYAKTEKKESDTRPIQGLEWMWVFVGIGIVVLIVIFVKKNLNKSL